MVRISTAFFALILTFSADFSDAKKHASGKHCKVYKHGNGHSDNVSWWTRPNDDHPENPKVVKCCQKINGSQNPYDKICRLIRRNEKCEEYGHEPVGKPWPLPSGSHTYTPKASSTRVPGPSKFHSSTPSNSGFTSIYISSSSVVSSSAVSSSVSSVEPTSSEAVSVSLSEASSSTESVESTSSVDPKPHPSPEPSSEEPSPTPTLDDVIPNPTSSKEPEPEATSTDDPLPEPTSPSSAISIPAPQPTLPVCTPSGETCRFDDPGACCSMCCIRSDSGPVCCNMDWLN